MAISRHRTADPHGAAREDRRTPGTRDAAPAPTQNRGHGRGARHSHGHGQGHGIAMAAVPRSRARSKGPRRPRWRCNKPRRSRPGMIAASGGRCNSESIQGVAFLHRESRPNTQPNRTIGRQPSLDRSGDNMLKRADPVRRTGDRNPPDARYRVQLGRRARIVAYTAGKMKKNGSRRWRRSGHDRNVALRSGKGPADLSVTRDERPIGAPRVVHRARRPVRRR